MDAKLRARPPQGVAEALTDTYQKSCGDGHQNRRSALPLNNRIRRYPVRCRCS